MNRKILKWGLLSLIFVLTMVFFVGCGSHYQEENIQGNEEKIATDVNKNKMEGSGSHFPITVTDAVGQEVTIDSEPQSIISLQASNTEISFALGLGDKIVGVTDYDNYPEEALEKTKVGAQNINVELILSLLPDLILVAEYHYQNYEDILHQFKDAGITVVVIGNATSFEDVYKSIQLIADVTGTNEKADEIITDMKHRLAAIKEKTKNVTDKKKVWVEVSPAPDIYTTGKGTFMQEMLESINAINAAEEQEGWVKLTEEEIVQLNPDVIITTYGFFKENPKADVLAREGWGEVPAIKNEQVFDVDNDTVTRPGPRLIDGVETLAKLIYPEIFK